MKTMYPAQVNSPGTELAAAIDAGQDTILVADGSVLPDGPNLLTIGTDEAAETILYTGKTGDELTGVTRGFQGTAQSWVTGTKVARYFTAYDHDAAISNISELTTLSDATRDRLDIVERQDVVLNAGLQILNTQRRAAFSLNGIKGRTIVNRMGRHGELNSINQWIAYGGTIQVASNEAILTSNGTASNPQIYNFNIGLAPSVGDKLFFRAKALSDTPLNYFRLTLYDGNNKKHVGVSDILNPDINKYYDIGCIVTITQEMIDNWSAISIRVASYYPSTVTGAISKFSQLAVYQIPSDSSATVDELLKLYPYVDSVQPVRNPYAIRYGENLLPPFYEWLSKDSYVTSTDLGLGKATITISNSGTGLYSLIKVKEGQSYAVSVGAISAGSRLRIGVNNGSSPTVGTFIADIHEGNKAQVITIPSGVTEIAVVFLNLADYSGGYPAAFSVESPMLTLGSEAKPFKPREDSMLALQTDLFADPVTGANADEVFEKDGQYYKLAKWKKVVFDEKTIANMRLLSPVKYTGYSRVRLADIPGGIPLIPANSSLVKYNGTSLPVATNWSTDGPSKECFAQAYDSSNFNYILVNIPQSESGWGDNYTPTADEFKAYFMGWKMYDAAGNASSVYNGSGGKAWVNLAKFVKGDHSEYTTTLPTVPAVEYTPYQLVYQLATPTVEPIVSEGMLTFNEGDNQVEVGTGIVVRESATPSLDSNGVWNIGNPVANSSSKGFKYKAKSVEAIYKNSLRDNGWKYYVTAAYGALAQEIQPKMIYDPSAAYSVTYLMLDKSPIVPFSGSYAANEKAMLQELTDSVQQNTTAVSVLMNKKADKDESLTWIRPTLLNGWANVEGFGYSKDDSGLVYVRGRISSGITTTGTLVFMLPDEFRPKIYSKHLVSVYAGGTGTSTGVLNVNIDGTVIVDHLPGNTWVGLNFIFYTK
ncbi:hypothetical protein ACFCW7_09280 [Paenibacillus glucanolyticus]|uniref:hypothetical protein n=1 Tax=Paenibacillus glucanolyticus TaxID=59843 RepID=UPI0035E321B6